MIAARFSPEEIQLIEQHPFICAAIVIFLFVLVLNAKKSN
jgi:hypothetical protein